MGWSEKYWEDVKSELERPATGPEPAGAAETPDQPTADRPTADPPTADPPAAGRPTEQPEKD